MLQQPRLFVSGIVDGVENWSRSRHVEWNETEEGDLVALSETKLAGRLLSLMANMNGDALLESRCEKIEASPSFVRSQCSEDCLRVVKVVELLDPEGEGRKYLAMPDDHFEIYEKRTFPSPPREEKTKFEAWWEDRDSRRMAFATLDVKERTTLHGLAKEERAVLTRKYDRRAKLAYSVFAEQSPQEARCLFSSPKKISEIPLGPAGERFWRACVEAIAAPLKDDFVMEILGGAYLDKLTDHELEKLATVLFEEDVGQSGECYMRAAQRFLLAHIDHDDGRCRRFVAACKRMMLGTYEDLKRGRLKSTGWVLELLDIVARAECPIDWGDTPSEDLFLKAPSEMRRKTYDRPFVTTRLDACAFCDRKRSDVYRLFTCSQCYDVAFCGLTCQKAALKQKKHPRDCGPPFRPKPSAYRRAVVDFCMSVFAVASHLVATGVWTSFGSIGNSEPLSEFLGAAPCSLYSLRPVEGHNVVARAFSYDIIEEICAGDYRDWLSHTTLPVIPQDTNLCFSSNEDAVRDIEASSAAIKRKTFRKLLKSVAETATTFDAELYASFDRHYSRPNALGTVPPRAEPLHSILNNQWRRK